MDMSRHIHQGFSRAARGAKLWDMALQGAAMRNDRVTFRARTTERLTLRAIRPDDWPAFHRYMSDPEVTTWLPEGRMDEDMARAWVDKSARDDAPAVAILTREPEAFIGHMVFYPWAGSHTYEIGWVFGREHQGRGYATEAAAALLAHAFETLGCHRVIATCQPENIASWRVMEKLRMRREGLLLQCIQRGPGEWWDEYLYAILADEYRGAASSQAAAKS